MYLKRINLEIVQNFSLVFDEFYYEKDEEAPMRNPNIEPSHLLPFPCLSKMALYHMLALSIWITIVHTILFVLFRLNLLYLERWDLAMVVVFIAEISQK